LVPWLVQCVVAIFLFVLIHFIIKVGFKLLVYGNCSFVIGEKGVYHKQILEEQTALGYIVLQKGKSEA
jgi:hypothetical protein